MKSLTFSCLICALNLYFAQKLLRKAKVAQVCLNRKKMRLTPKIAQKLPSTIGTGLPPERPDTQASLSRETSLAARSESPAGYG